jgi:hypothetical protein
MFIGHYGVGLGLKKIAPKIPLWLLFLATNFIDLLWPVLLLLGLEKVEIVVGITKVTPLNFLYYPFSHSLVAVLGWSLLFGILYFAKTRFVKESVVLGLAVLSHWILDLIVHRPDLPLAFSQKTFYGFGLWNYEVLTIILELAILFVGLYLYLHSVNFANRSGKYILGGLIVFLVVLYLANVFGPPPTNVKLIAYAGNASWLMVFWAMWIDKKVNINIPSSAV